MCLEHSSATIATSRSLSVSQVTEENIKNTAIRNVELNDRTHWCKRYIRNSSL